MPGRPAACIRRGRLANPRASDARRDCRQFNTFMPGWTTLAKQSIITAKAVGDEVYLLVATTSKFKTAEPVLREVAASFAATPTGAPAKVRHLRSLRRRAPWPSGECDSC